MRKIWLWCSNWLATYCNEKLSGWIDDGLNDKSRRSNAIKLTRQDGRIHEFVEFLYRKKSYIKFINHHSCGWLRLDKLTPVTKRTILVYSLSYAVVSIICIILTAMVVITMVLPLLLNDKNEFSSGNFVSFLSALGTTLAALYAAKSAREMVVANRINQHNSKAESMDRRFATLLEQHNNYLTVINAELSKDEMSLFSSAHLQSLTLKQSLKLLRGENDRIVIDGRLFILNENGRVDVSDEDVCEKDRENAQRIITNCNDFAKNNLSPYMRILYHLLKTVKKEYGDNNYWSNNIEKEYTNIVRSIIPNDLLLIIALNSVDFYHERLDFKKIMADKMSAKIYNDYYKFFALLRRYSFFEHLNLPDEMDKINYKFQVNQFSRRELKRFEISSGEISLLETGNGKKVYVIRDSGLYAFPELIYAFSQALKEESSLAVLFAFYDLGRRNTARKILQEKFIHALDYAFKRQKETPEEGQQTKKTVMMIGISVNYEVAEVYVSTAVLDGSLFGDIPIN